MINNENFDKARVIELGALISDNFDRVNDIDKIIKDKEIIGYFLDNKLVGFIIFKRLYEVIDLLYIVVDPIYRKRNIGSVLLKELLNMDYEKIMLEVSVSNIPAINLYKKYGFKTINIRKNYYEGKDAYIMEVKK